MTTLKFVNAAQDAESFKAQDAFATLIRSSRQDPFVKLAQQALGPKDCDITRDEFVNAFAGTQWAESAGSTFDGIYTRFRSGADPEDTAYITPDEFVDLWKSLDDMLPKKWAPVTNGVQPLTLPDGQNIGTLETLRRTVPLGAFNWLEGLEPHDDARGDWRPISLINAKLNLDVGKLGITQDELVQIIKGLPQYEVVLSSVMASSDQGTDGNRQLSHTFIDVPSYPQHAESLQGMSEARIGNTTILTWSTTSTSGENYNDRELKGSDSGSIFGQMADAATASVKSGTALNSETAGQWKIPMSGDSIAIDYKVIADIPGLANGLLSATSVYHPDNPDFANRAVDGASGDVVQKTVENLMADLLAFLPAYIELKTANPGKSFDELTALLRKTYKKPVRD
jgi:hypothetical protein